MYIDTSADTRICLNAANADTATKLKTARTISLGGAVTGSSSFDGSANITITTSVNHTHSYAGSASAGGDANRAVKVKDSANGKDITITYGKDAYNSVTYLAGWDNYELGNIKTENITVGKATTLANARTISLSGSAAGSVSFDGSANVTIPATINRLDKNATFIEDGAGGLSYYDSDISNVTNNADWSVPEKGWYQIYHNSLSVSKYWTELGFPVNNVNGLAWRQRRSDAFYGWYRILDSNNYTNYTVTKTGDGASGNWGISVSGNAATATKLAASKTISLSGDVKGSVSFDGSANVTIASTLAANYAGSSSKGGAATSANKLNTNAGSTTLPVYFADGIPKAISTTGIGISITGNATTASKLASARTISISGITTGSATFDGSNNVNIQTKFETYTIKGANTDNYPFRRFATATLGTNPYTDAVSIIRLTQKIYYNGPSGVCKLAIRTNTVGHAVEASAYWLENSKKDMPKIYIAILGKSGENVIADLYYQCPITYPETEIEIISLKRGNWTFYNSVEAKDTTTTDKKNSTECYTSVADGGTLIRNATYTSITESTIVSSAASLTSSAGSSNVPIYIDSNGIPAAIGYQINKTVPSNAVFTDTTYSSGNGITIDGNRKINHSNSAITAKTAYGSTATTASANGGSITVTDVKYDAYGHITGSTDRTIKLSQTTYTLAGLMGSSAKGSATQPIYWTGSAWANTTYTLGKSVPSDAKFTDTVYSLPTASSTLGGVKTTSTVTNASGYTACPIIGGVPYYKDTNTTYNLSSFGITASAAELNYCKGVTSAIQTQLNGKVPTSRTVNGKALSSNISLSYGDVGAAAASHSHSYLPLSGGTVTGVVSITNTTASSSTSTGALKVSGGIGCAGNIYGANVYGAVWNDYAEFRISDCLEPGRVVCENGNDTLSISTKRLQPGANVISDTYGFSIGETDEAKCPIAVSGRVLAYGYEDRELFRKNIGHPVCAGPNGTVSIMTDEEYKNYGYCAIGTISAVPDYEEWGTGKVKVDNRIWIKI